MKKKERKDVVLGEETSEWVPSLKGEDLESFNKVRAALVKAKKLKSLAGLQDRLDKAGKKGAPAELDKFISENSLLLEADPAVEVQVTVDVAVRVGQDGVDQVVRAGGEQGDVQEAGAAAAEFVKETALLAKKAGPNGESPLPTYKEPGGKEVKKIRESERRADAKWFGEKVGELGQKWTDQKISREKIIAAGLLEMKTKITQGIKELEDVEGTPMSKAELGKKRENLSQLLRAMSLETEGLLGPKNRSASEQQQATIKPEQQSGEEKGIPEQETVEARTEKAFLDYHEAWLRVHSKVMDIDTIIQENFFTLDEDIDKNAMEAYDDRIYKPFLLKWNELPNRLSKLDGIANPYARLQETEKLLFLVEQMGAEADKIKEFLETNPFLKPAVATEKAAKKKERFKDAMGWLKDRGHGLAERAKNLKIEHHVRVLGERYNKLPRKYKYATSAVLLIGGASAGFVGGSVGAAALGMIGIGRFGYRAVGAAAAFVSIEAKLQARNEVKEGIFNKHPKAIATGIAALILIGAPGMIFRELGGAALDHAGLSNASAPQSLEAIHKGGFEDSSYQGKTLETIHKGGFEGDDYGAKPLEAIHSGNFENSEWSGNGIIEIHKGGNAWNAIKDYLQENKLAEGLSKGQRDYVIASIEKRVNEMSDADFAKTGFSTRDIGLVYENQKIDLSQILADKSEMDAILERAGHLGAATPPEDVAVAETTSQVSGVEETHAVADVHSVSQSVAENVTEHGEVSKDPAVHLWEMRHPGEAVPKSLLREAMESRAHDMPIESNPLFAEEALSRVEEQLKDMFGSAGSESGQWNAWKEYSASHVLKLPRTGYAGPLVVKLQDYLKELIEKTGLEPTTRGGRLETLEHFIIRAEAGSLSMDLGCDPDIDLNSAPGLYEDVDPDRVSGRGRAPRYVPPEPVSEMVPQYRPPTYSNHGYVPEHRPPHFSNYGYTPQHRPPNFYNYGHAPQHRPGSYYGHGHGHRRGPHLKDLLPPFKKWWNPFSGHK